jgi:hypothetical protein
MLLLLLQNTKSLTMKKMYAFASAALFAAGVSAQSVVITELQYNPPGSGGPNSATEFLELYNNGGSSVDLTGWKIQGSGFGAINFTIPAHTLSPGDYVVFSNNTSNLSSLYGVTGIQYTGSLLNVGMTLLLKNNSNATIDSVPYSPNAPWPTIAAGHGVSIQLCDYNSDNSIASSWKRSITKTANVSTRDLYGTPGSQNTCPTSPVIQFRFNGATVQENQGVRTYGLFIDNPASSATTVQIEAINFSGTVGQDITFTSPQTITFPANFQGMDTSFTLTVIDDTLFEPEEQILFVLKNPSNGAILRTDSFMLLINEDFQDRPVNRDFFILGIADDEAGGAARLVEVYARVDIADISRYGLGCANNGGASPGVEFGFPSMSVKKGENFFITNDSAAFHAFYGFPADFIDNGGTNGALSFNGNDAMEMYEDGRIVDRYGVAGEDGVGKVWEFTDGWGKRKPKTGPDGNTFVAANWTFSGKDVFDGVAKNANASSPYPLNTYFYEDPEDTSTISVNPVSHSDKQIMVYPVPSRGHLNVVSPVVLKLIEVYSVTGDLRAKVQPTSVRQVIDTRSYGAGAYILKIELEDGNVVFKRFVCE